MDEVFDFVIVGSGAASFCAALVVKAAGKEPLVLEKTEVVGGSTAMSGGVLWAPDNPLLARDGVPDSQAKALTYLTQFGDCGPGASAARRKAFVAQSPKMVEFLLAHGLKFKRMQGYSDYYDERPGGTAEGRTLIAELFDLNELGPWKSRLRPGLIPSPIGFDESLKMVLIKRTWIAKWLAIKVAFRSALQKLTGRHLVSAGYALQGRMLQAAVKAGVQIRTDAPVQELLVEGGRVVGVRVTWNGVERRIGARRGVLINAGGFSHNKEMRERYQPKPASIDWTHANPGDTGEMIQEAMRIGAAVDLMEEAWWIPTAFPPKPHRAPRVMVLTDTAKPHCIVVDGAGQRYMNEAASYMEVGQKMYRRHAQAQAVPSWMILDSRHRRNYFLAHQMPGVTPREWLDSGFLKKADTLEGLAAQCGLDAASLTATVARFNGFARRGVDEDFGRGARQYDQWFADPTHKPVPTLGGIEEAPFYALQIFPGDVGTAGGIVADEFARALRPQGEVIKGLYAAGNSTAGVTGRFYVGAGASVGASMTFGFIAAQHAVGGLDRSYS